MRANRHLPVVVAEQFARVPVAQHDPPAGHDRWPLGETEAGREQAAFHGSPFLDQVNEKCSKSKSDSGWPTLAAEYPVILVL